MARDRKIPEGKIVMLGEREPAGEQGTIARAALQKEKDNDRH